MTVVPLPDWYPDIYDRWRKHGRRLSVPVDDRVGYTNHHTAGGQVSNPLSYARWVADWHFSKWGRPGGYNFLIGTDGVIRAMCGWGFVGAHAPGFNYNRIGVAFQGLFTSRLPNSRQLEAYAELVGTNRVPNDQNGHRDNGSGTACPGDRLYSQLPLNVKEIDMSIASWAKAAWDKARNLGVFSEYTSPKDPVTAEALAVFLDRAGLLDLPNAERQKVNAERQKVLDDFARTVLAEGSSGYVGREVVRHLRDHPSSDRGGITLPEADKRYARKGHGHTATTTIS